MTRIDAKFADLKSQGKKAFVAYVMAGDPAFDTALDFHSVPPDSPGERETSCP